MTTHQLLVLLTSVSTKDEEILEILDEFGIVFTPSDISICFEGRGMREFTVLSSCLLVEDIAEAARQKLIASTFLAWLFEETMESNQQMIHSRVTEKLQAFGAIQQHHQPIDVTHLSSTLMKKNFAAIRWLSRHYGVQCVLTVLPPHGSMKKEESQLLLFPITWANMDALELLRSVIASFRSNEDFETHMTGNETRRVHIYIDHSNITFSARDMTGTLINRRHLVELIEDGRTIEKRMAAESVPHRMKKDVVAAWNELGYTGSIVGRVAGQTEQNVDELIHTAMMTDAAKTYITPRKAVICTGDGNKNEGRPSNFPDTVTCLLQKGWLVELWSFEKSLNRMWLRFTDHYPEQFVIKYFDEHVRWLVSCHSPDDYLKPYHITKALHQEGVTAQGNLDFEPFTFNPHRDSPTIRK